MGLFDFFKKKPKIFTFTGYLWIIGGLNKKFQNAEVFKLGKTQLTEEEKSELISRIEKLKGKVILEFDQQEFMQEIKLECNPKIKLFPFVSVSDKKFRALYENDVLKWVTIMSMKGETEGTVSDEASLKSLDEKFRAQFKNLNKA